MINQAGQAVGPRFSCPLGHNSDSFFLLICLSIRTNSCLIAPVPLGSSALPLCQGCVQYSPIPTLHHLWFVEVFAVGAFPSLYRAPAGKECDILLACGIWNLVGIWNVSGLGCSSCHSWWQTGAQSAPGAVGSPGWAAGTGALTWQFLMDSREQFAAGCLLCCGLLFVGEGNLIFF